jgi:hypothetical protein
MAFIRQVSGEGGPGVVAAEPVSGFDDGEPDVGPVAGERDFEVIVTRPRSTRDERARSRAR